MIVLNREYLEKTLLPKFVRRQSPKFSEYLRRERQVVIESIIDYFEAGSTTVEPYTTNNMILESGEECFALYKPLPHLQLSLVVFSVESVLKNEYNLIKICHGDQILYEYTLVEHVKACKRFKRTYDKILNSMF